MTSRVNNAFKIKKTKAFGLVERKKTIQRFLLLINEGNQIKKNSPFESPSISTIRQEKCQVQSNDRLTMTAQ